MTPTVTSMSPVEGDASTQTITLAGTVFTSTACQNQVMFGADSACVVASSTDTQITCDIDGDGFKVGSLQPLSVVVANYGKASIVPRNLGFTAAPIVASITPSSGSTHGGTMLTILGSGLCHDCPSLLNGGGSVDAAVVNIVSVGCTVQQIDFEKIVCETKAASGSVAGPVTITVNVLGVPHTATCPNGCNYDFVTTGAPVIDSADGPITSANQELTLSGSQLAGTTDVYLGAGQCTVVSEAATAVTCNVGTPPAGSLALKLRTADGFSNTLTVTVTGSVSGLSISTGSTAGGTDIVINGFGFDTSEGGTTVAIDGGECVVAWVTGTQIDCTTPAHTAATTDLVVTSNGVALDSVSFTYSDSATPTITIIAPTEGVSGDSVVITGTPNKTHTKWNITKHAYFQALQPTVNFYHILL